MSNEKKKLELSNGITVHFSDQATAELATMPNFPWKEFNDYILAGGLMIGSGAVKDFMLRHAREKFSTPAGGVS